MKKEEQTFYSLRDAAEYAHISAQAVYLAIRKGHLKAEKVDWKGKGRKLQGKQWKIHAKDIDEYRANKFNPDKKRFNGEPLFDIAKGKWSVHHVAKVMSEALRRKYPTDKIYYMLRMGQIQGVKRGGAWVLSKETAIEIYKMEMQIDENQTRFA